MRREAERKKIGEGKQGGWEDYVHSYRVGSIPLSKLRSIVTVADKGEADRKER